MMYVIPRNEDIIKQLSHRDRAVIKKIVEFFYKVRSQNWPKDISRTEIEYVVDYLNNLLAKIEKAPWWISSIILNDEEMNTFNKYIDPEFNLYQLEEACKNYLENNL